MIDSLIQTMRSLVAVMDEETVLLRNGRRDAVGELAAAKLKLTAQLEKDVAERDRERRDWREQLDASSNEMLAEATDALQRSAAENASLLQRQIDLSRELLDAIAAEAKRLGGTQSETYAAGGALKRVDQPAPISINASL